jgi:hypothetical protein
MKDTPATENDISVIGVIPANNFFTAWKAQPQWRLHVNDKYYICPSGSYYLLSAWNPQFQQWLKRFLEDMLTGYPLLKGIEVVEPQIDPHWQLTSIIHSKHFDNYRSRYPGKSKQGETFIQFHARGLTRLLGMVGEGVHRAGKQYYISQCWTADDRGELIKSDKIKNNSGFDFIGVLNLPKDQRPDFLIVEPKSFIKL